MKMTIYLPDDLAAMVKDHTDLNVSAVCQAALRDELTRREELAKLDKGMKRVEVYIDARGADVAFVGKELHYDRLNTGRGVHDMTAYLTRRHRIAIYDNDAQALYQFDSFDELASDPVWRDGSPDFVSALAESLGEKHVIELDI